MSTHAERVFANEKCFPAELLELAGHRVPYKAVNAHVKAYHTSLIRNRETYHIGANLAKRELVAETCQAMQTVF